MLNPRELFFLAVVCVNFVQLVESSQQVLKDMSTNFKKALDVCREELNLPDTIYGDFTNFWKEDYVVTNRDTGCAVLCLAKKLDLVDPDLKLHHGNAKDFAMQHGADEALAMELVNIIHVCETNLLELTDVCMRVLEVGKCFKAEIHKKGMAPPVDVAVGEILAEV